MSGYVLERLKSKNNITVITPEDDDQRMGIATFSVQSSPNLDLESVLGALKEKKITISAREGFFRISPHMYNTEKEIDIVIDELFKHV